MYTLNASEHVILRICLASGNKIEKMKKNQGEK